jgi:hypothetical protein
LISDAICITAKVATNNNNAIRNIIIGAQYSDVEEGKCGAIAPLASPLLHVDPDAVDVMMPAT